MFDPQEAPPGLSNYWGYNPISFFAPHHGYASSDEPLRVLDEFRDMVKALHRAEIEVILDVVYNHTAEAGADGATLSFKGLETAATTVSNAETGHATRTTAARAIRSTRTTRSFGASFSTACATG